MQSKALTLAAALAAAAFCHAQVSILALGDPGSLPSYAKVGDFGITRTYDVLEGAQSSLRTYLPGATLSPACTFRCGLDANPAMDDWVNSLLNGSYLRKSGSIVYLRSDGRRAFNFFDCFPVRWSAPECDSSNRRESGMTLDIAGGDCDDRFYRGDVRNVVQKKWLPANFRLRIDGLDEPCARVNKIEAITIKQKAIVGAQIGANLIGGDLDGDGVPDRVASDLVFTVRSGQALAFREWQVDAQGPTIRAGSIDYNDEFGRPMHRFSFDCCIVSVTEMPGSSMCVVRCALAGNLIWSPRSN